MTDLEALKLLENTPIQFGLKAQGHIETIEKLLSKHKTLKFIAEKIGWAEEAMCLHYIWYLQHERSAQSARIEELTKALKRARRNVGHSEDCGAILLQKCECGATEALEILDAALSPTPTNGKDAE